MQPATCKQSNINGSLMFFQIAFMSLSPYADKSLFLLQHGKTGDKIIPTPDISAAHFFKNCFLHNRFHLSYRSLSIDFLLTDRLAAVCLPADNGAAFPVSFLMEICRYRSL